MTKPPLKVLLVGHDRGGVNLLTPLMSHWRTIPNAIDATFLSTPDIEYEVSIQTPSVKLIAQSHSLRRRRYLESWAFGDEELEAIFRNEHWDLMLTSTSLNSKLESKACLWAKKHSVACATLIDMWTEYERRFDLDSSRVLPDVLLVLDERMKDEVKSALGDGVRMEITGSPHFCELIETRRQGPRTDGKIRFISEPVANNFPEAGIHEFDIAELIIETLAEKGRAAELMLRPHPKDDAEAWRRFAYAYRDRGVRLDTEPSWSCHATTSMAIGLSSMLLLELAMAGIPVAAYHFPGSDESYYCLPEEEFGIRRLQSQSDLAEWFERADPPRVREDNIALHESAIDRITNLILDGALGNG